MAIHFSLEGCSLHRDSNEAKEQATYYLKYKEDLGLHLKRELLIVSIVNLKEGSI